jgi:hypothetical protein
MAFFSKNQCYYYIFVKTSSSLRKNTNIFAKFFGENILEIITLATLTQNAEGGFFRLLPMTSFQFNAQNICWHCPKENRSWNSPKIKKWHFPTNIIQKKTGAGIRQKEKNGIFPTNIIFSIFNGTTDRKMMKKSS